MLEQYPNQTVVSIIGELIQSMHIPEIKLSRKKGLQQAKNAAKTSLST